RNTSERRSPTNGCDRRPVIFSEPLPVPPGAVTRGGVVVVVWTTRGRPATRATRARTPAAARKIPVRFITGSYQEKGRALRQQAPFPSSRMSSLEDLRRSNFDRFGRGLG